MEGKRMSWNVIEGPDMSWTVLSYHQIDILSEKSYGWCCAVGYVGGHGGYVK